MTTKLNPLGLPAAYVRRHAFGPMLARLQEERAGLVAFVEQTVSQCEDQKRDLSDTEDKTLKDTQKRIAEVDAQIEPLQSFAKLADAANTSARSYTSGAPAGGDHDRGERTGLGVTTSARGHEYRTRGEVIVDVLKAGRTGKGGLNDEQARSRLMSSRVPFEDAPEEYTRAISNEITSDVPGLLPKPIVGAVDNDLDPMRPFISSIGAKDLGSIPGKTFTRPVVTQHVTAGKQTAEKTEVPSRKMTVGGVDFTKETYGGALDVSRQTIDWTSPSAWDAILNDLTEVYGLTVEEVAAQAFATAVTQSVPAPATQDLKGWAGAIYGAAVLSYGGVKRLPNHIWCSLDMWAQMGAIVDVARLSFSRGNGEQLGSSSPTDFGGNMLDIPRTVVPSFPAKTVIIGVKEKTEFYEEKIGLLTAVEPRLLGVEIAYGGYVAYGTLRANAFAKVAPAA